MFKIIPSWWSIHNLAVWIKIHRNPDLVVEWVKECIPYWEALRHDDPVEWAALPPKAFLWLVTSEGSLVEDTKWTAAAKTGARECLQAWSPDKLLKEGQQVWGTAEEGFGVPMFGGGSVLHSIAPLTFDPKIAYLVKGWLEAKVVDATQASWEGVSPLHVFGAYGHASGIEVLMQHGADPSLTTKTGATPLEYAAKYGTAETVKKLLHWGAWNVTKAEQERVLDAAITGRLGKGMEAVFLRARLFPSVTKWSDARIRLQGTVKEKEIQWAAQLWEQEEKVVPLNREQRRAQGDFTPKGGKK